MVKMMHDRNVAFLPASKKGDRGGFAADLKQGNSQGESPLLPFFKRGKSMGFVATAMSLALAACTVGPDYVRPTFDPPARFVRDEAPTPAAANAGDAKQATAGDMTAAPDADADASANVQRTDTPTTPASDAGFWTTFSDPLLTQLVDDALGANHDLRIALSRYDRANALLRGARFDLLPTVAAQAGASESRASADQAPGVPRADRDGESYDAGIVAGWELDLFGRIRRNVESQRADATASAADLQAAQVAIVGEVARTYFELRGLQERLRVARGNADNQRDTLRLVQAQFDAGRGTGFDTARARAQLATTQSRIPAFDAQVAFAMHRLAVLTGRTPDALVAQLEPQRPLPALPARLDAGTPGELLRRRPDIAAAEARLHAATARIGVATADLFPRFTLSGLIGSQAIDAGALFERDSETRLVACVRASPPRTPMPKANSRATARRCCWRWRTPRTHWCATRARGSKTDTSNVPRSTAHRPRAWRACASTPAPPACWKCSTPSAPSCRRRTPSPTAAPAVRPARWRCTRRWPAAGHGSCRSARNWPMRADLLLLPGEKAGKHRGHATFRWSTMPSPRMRPAW